MFPHHHRRSTRLPDYDYSQLGAYFVTLVTRKRTCRFGEIDRETVILNKDGQIARSEWNHLADRFPGVALDEFVIMPDHIHGIIFLQEVETKKEVIKPAITERIINTTNQLKKPISITSLGTIISSYKSTVARLIIGIHHTTGVPFWDRNYYEYIIRDENALNHIRTYILENPRRWDENRKNPFM